MSSGNAALGQLAIITLFTEAAPNVLAGAACGALIYMLNAHKLDIPHRAMFFLISFIGGVLSGDTFASIIQGSFGMLSIQSTISPAVGAFLSAAAIVNLSIKLGNDPLGFLTRIREIFSGTKDLQ